MHNVFQALEKQGFDVTMLPINQERQVDLEALKEALRSDAILINVMLTNNEAVGKIPVSVKDLGVDMLSLTAHKFYGPKGVGALYIREGVKISPLLEGGHQEKIVRPDTENVPGAVSMATGTGTHNF